MTEGAQVSTALRVCISASGVIGACSLRRKPWRRLRTVTSAQPINRTARNVQVTTALARGEAANPATMPVTVDSPTRRKVTEDITPGYRETVGLRCSVEETHDVRWQIPCAAQVLPGVVTEWLMDVQHQSGNTEPMNRSAYLREELSDINNAASRSTNDRRSVRGSDMRPPN